MILQIFPVPFHGFLQPLMHGVLRIIPQQVAGLVDIGQRVGNVARTVGAVKDIHLGDLRIELRKIFFQISHKLIQRGALAVGGIVDGIEGRRIGGLHGEDVHQDHIVDVGEVATVLTVAVDDGRLVRHQLLHEEGNHCRIGAVGVLPPAEHVEIAQADGLHSVGFGKDIGIELVHILGDGIGRQGFPDHILNLGERLAVAIGGGAGGIDEPLDAGIATCYQHLQKTRHIYFVRCDRVFDGSGYRTECRLMKYKIDSFNGLAAIIHVADIAHLQGKRFGIFHQQGEQVPDLAGGKVVEHRYLMASFQQLFREVRSNKTGSTGDQYISHLKKSIIRWHACPSPYGLLAWAMVL